MSNSSKRRQRFENVAGKRIQSILDKIELLGNCSNKHNYEYSEIDVRKMFSAIREKLKHTESKFSTELSKRSKTKFEF